MDKNNYQVSTGVSETYAPSWGEFIRNVKRMAICVVVTAVVMCGILAAMKIASLEAELQAALENREAVNITNLRIRDRLIEIGELATATYEYEDTRTVTDSRNLFGWSIPGTMNEIVLGYRGVVNVGYDVTQIKTEVDTDKYIIKVRLPQPEVQDNYVLLDGLVCTGKNNLLNPIKVEKLPLIFEGITEEAIAGAMDGGIYQKAETRMKTIIEEFLAVFPDYSVVFE